MTLSMAEVAMISCEAAINNDTLIGGDGNDVLNGGNDIDIMTGGLGNDIYIVNFFGTSANGSSEQVIENSGEGYDKVISSVSISSLYDNVEGLILEEGSTATVGNGNSEKNKIEGNSRNNSLNGFAGDDQLFGGAGNDLLLGGDGLDFLYGEDGNDLLVGGNGSDRLTGGAGRDAFRIDVLDGSTDLIYDFSVVDDLIEISKSAFGLSLALGTLSAGNFVLGSKASDVNDFFVYDAMTGRLTFDSDGSGAGMGAGIAILTTKPSGFSNADIRIIA
ncbi:MAG: calcium-binding protein [Phormidesmis sp. RL_2_1]|nr:calcium-binding protein [Phormidesmis sp. RL_2_1]